MKIIVSHDVDHLYVSEHYADMVVPKFIVRAFIELFSGTISVKTFFKRIFKLFMNRWHRIPEIVTFNNKNNIPATFFFGMAKGKGMMYSNKSVQPWIKYVLDNGIDAGVHGIAYCEEQLIKKENERFFALSDKKEFGIRIHYLRQKPDTLLNLEKSGYVFDSSDYALKNPYKIGSMWEFPLSLMEGYLFENGKPWQTQSIEQVKKKTIEIFEEAKNKNLQYFSILFHDRYFDSSFKDWKNWYIWLIWFLKEQKCIFISYQDAIKELEQ